MQLPAHFPTEPKLIWNYFHEITQIPRPSRKEDKFREYIIAKASGLGLKSDVDAVGNVIVYKPASKGRENGAPVVIQNHMDMVTDATPDRTINFATDPIVTLRDGDWLKADRTTLGADNGIGCAAALALMEDASIEHPPLELLFTIDEETGMKGVWGVDVTKLSGKRMLNLDTEEWGSLYLGSAGGIDYEFKRTFSFVPSALVGESVKLVVGGFLGGHSGVDIHEQRGNAVKCLLDWLSTIPAEAYELAEIRGGKAHNIIPRDAFALIKVKDKRLVEVAAREVEARWKSFMPKNDRGVRTSIEAVNDLVEVASGTDKKTVLGFLNGFPHGAHAYDPENRTLVTLSNNMAVTLFVRGEFYLQSSVRFTDRGECVGFERQLAALAEGYSIEVQMQGEYPSWKPEWENPLANFVSSKYESLFKQRPHVKAIHAGLECGILRSKMGQVDVVSFGPTITGAHSPDERLYIPSVGPFWKLLTEILKDL